MFKLITAIILSIALILCPIVRVSTIQAIGIPTFVIGLFLAVSLSMGFYFDLHNVNISTWAEGIINAYLTANGYNSIEAWLGLNYESETTVSGSFLGLTPSLFAKIKLAVEFGVSNGDMPSGGTTTQPTTVNIEPLYYLPNFTYTDVRLNQTYTYTNFNVPALSDLVVNAVVTSNQFGAPRIIKYIPSNYLYSIPYGYITSVSDGFRLCNFTSNSLTGYSGFTNQNNNSLWLHTVSNDITNHGISNQVNKPSNRNQPINSSTPIYALPVCTLSENSYWFTIVYGYLATNGNYYIFVNSNDTDWAHIPVVTNTSSGDIYSVGQPGYNFNNADLIYIDLQIGDLLSALQALTSLITALNNNLVTWTIAIQSSDPNNLPVDTRDFIDFVDYCNEQTNLFLSGTSTISSCVGNMYQELYNILSITSNTTLCDACINTYNAFINKLTLFIQYSNGSGSGSFSNLPLVQDFYDDIMTIYDSFNGTNQTTVINNAITLLSNYTSQATTVEDVLGLNAAFENFLSLMDYNLDLPNSITSSISSLNTIVDNFLSGNIDSGTCLTTLLTSYKTSLNSCRTVQETIALLGAYQNCLDRVSLEAFTVDPAGLGTVVPEVIQQEDDLLELVNVQELSSMLQFQNWQFMNSGEANLYREYFQTIFDSDSPFYVFVYVPLVLGIVGIILGTRIHFGGKNVSAESKGRKH